MFCRHNAVGLFVLLSAAIPSAAGTFRHDIVYDDGTTVWRDLDAPVMYGDQFHMIGGVQVDFSSFGSGVMIADQWVLTAAHVVAGVTAGTYVKFETDPDPDDPAFSDPNYDPMDWETVPLSGLFRVDALAIHEYYDDSLGPAGGFDIALLHLDAPITHTDPDYQPYSIYTGTGEIGQTGTPVGFGATGTGQPPGYYAETGAFFRLAGQNVIDSLATDPRLIDQFVERTVIDPVTGLPVTFTKEQIASQFLLSDFDDPETQIDDPLTPFPINEAHTNDGLNPLGDAEALPMEYSVAPGDSGGPMLINEGGEWKVAGLNSFIHGFPAPDGDGTDNATYSDIQGYLRVSLFQDWITEVLASIPIDIDTGLVDPFAPIEEDLLSTVTLANLGEFESQIDFFELLQLMSEGGFLEDPTLAVPEPSSLALLLPGIAVLLRRRRL